MASAMCAWVHVLESIKQTFHDVFFFISWFLWVVCSKCMHQWPWIHSKFLSIEGTGLVCLNVIEIVSKSAEWTLFTDRFCAVLFVLFEHSKKVFLVMMKRSSIYIKLFLELSKIDLIPKYLHKQIILYIKYKK